MADRTQTATIRLTIGPAAVESVHDGDTLRMSADFAALWPDVKAFVTDIRVAHVNAAELKTDQGKAALAAVEGWLSEHGPRFELWIYGRDKYGRLLADVADDLADRLSAFVLTLPGSVPMSAHELSARLMG